MAGTPAEGDAVYGLLPPTLADARAVVADIHPDDVDILWPRLVASAGLTGDESDADAVPRIVAAMAATDPILELAALALTIRRRSHEELRSVYMTIERTR